MKILGEVKGYLIHKDGCENYILCKILKEYGKEKDDEYRCIEDLSSCKNTTERKLDKGKLKKVEKRWFKLMYVYKFIGNCKMIL